jgi:hypothetical protein
MGDFERLGSGSLWKSGPLFSTGTMEAELMVRELRVESAVRWACDPTGLARAMTQRKS